jgi:hypothetical protein
MSPENGLTAAAARMCDAVSRQDAGALQKAYDELRKAVVAAGEAERAAAAGALVPALAGLPVAYGGSLAKMIGAMVGMAGDPAPVLDVLARRACAVMEDAAVFASAWRTLNGALPSRQQDSLDAVAVRYAAAANGPQERSWVQAAAWWTGQEWAQPVLYLSQRADVRRALPDRARLLAAAERLTGEYPDLAPFLVGLLRVLDDERLAVLHRESGRGFWVTVSGVADNFQLHTLLAAALLVPSGGGKGGGAAYLPGTPPTAAMIAAADGTGDPMPPGGVTGQFNLVDARGQWIWNEGRPADIPVVNGHRVIVLDPPPYTRSWNAGRVYPYLKASLAIEPMTDAEAADWMALVRPAAQPSESPNELVVTDDLQIALPADRTVADVVDLVLSRAEAGQSYPEIDAALVTDLGLSKHDAELARDRAFGGIVRAGTGNEANRPSRLKDPVAHESYERALADPSLPARIYPDLFAR